LTFTGTSDTINLTAMPAIASTPSVVTLVQQLSGPISGSDFVLGTLPTGYAGTLQMSTDGTAVQLKVTSAPKPPAKGTTVTSVSLESGTSSFVISGTNGVANSVYYVLTSTNLTVWTPIATNSFDSNGDFSATLPYLKAENGRFYKIESQ
jgi:hypothetical protein